MYIILIGVGRVGYYLTKALLDEGHEVLAIEESPEICAAVNEELGSVCIRGDGCETIILEQAGTARADMMIAVTGDDGHNLVACQLAKHKFNVPRTIARVRNPRHEAMFKKLGVDVTINSTSVIMEAIAGEVPTHPLTHLLEIRDEGLEIVEIKVPPGSSAVGKSVRELAFPREIKLALVIRKEGKHRVPTLNTVIRAEDRIIALTSMESEKKLQNILRGTE